MGLFDGLLGGSGSSSVDDLYAGLLTPQQLAAIRQRSAGDDLLKLAGAFAQAGQASRLPTGGIGSALGQAAGSLAGSSDEAILKFLQAQKLGAEVIDKKSLAEARRALLADLQKSGQIPSGFLGSTPGAGGTPGTGEGSAPSPGGARAVSSSTASVTLPPEARALLDSIAGPESSGAYNARWPNTTFSGYADHPRIYAPGPEGPSSAAGRYQIVASTWDPIAQEAGLTDFTPESQDKAAWYLAQKEYSRKTGGDLLTDLKAGKTDQVASALAGQWATLRQGIGSYDRNLNKYNQGGPLQLAGDVPDQLPSLDELRRGLLADPRSLDKLRGVVANLQPGTGGGLLEQAYPNDPRRFGGAAPAADPLRQQYDAARARYGDRAPAESFDQYRARFANQAPGSGGGVPPAPDDGGGGGDDGGGVPVGSGLLRGGSPLLGGPLGSSPATAPMPQIGPAPGAGPLAAPVAPGPGPGPTAAAPGPGGLLAPAAPGARPAQGAPALPPAPPSNPEMQRYIYDIARKGALAEIAGLPNVYAPLLSALQASPQYKALVEGATEYTKRSVGLGFVGPEARAKEQVELEFAGPKAAAIAAANQKYIQENAAYQSTLDIAKELLTKNGVVLGPDGQVKVVKNLPEAIAAVDMIKQQQQGEINRGNTLFAAGGQQRDGTGPVEPVPGYNQLIAGTEAAKKSGDLQKTVVTVPGQRPREMDLTNEQIKAINAGKPVPELNIPGMSTVTLGKPVYNPTETALGETEAKSISEGYKSAFSSAQAIETNKTLRRLLDEGIYAGSGADYKVGLYKVGNALGITGKDTQDTVARTEAYFAAVGQTVLKLIPPLGTGNAVSDNDRRFVERIVGGQQNLDEKSMREILDINDRYAVQNISDHNKRVSTIAPGATLTDLAVKIPEPYAPAPRDVPRGPVAGPAPGLAPSARSGEALIPPPGMTIPPGATYLGIVGGVPKIRLPDGRTQSWSP